MQPRHTPTQTALAVDPAHLDWHRRSVYAAG
jgi:hypothetical protein